MQRSVFTALTLSRATLRSSTKSAMRFAPLIPATEAQITEVESHLACIGQANPGSCSCDCDAGTAEIQEQPARSDVALPNGSHRSLTDTSRSPELEKAMRTMITGLL